MHLLLAGMDWYMDLWAWGLDGFLQFVVVVLAHVTPAALIYQGIREQSSRR